jgi:hypothetical protein
VTTPPTDPESARAALSAAVSLLLRLLRRGPDPAKSKEHVLLSVLSEQRPTRGHSAELAALLDDLCQGPADLIAVGVGVGARVKVSWSSAFRWNQPSSPIK